MLLLVVLVVVLTELRLHNDDNYLRHEDDDGDKYAHFITMLTDAGVLKSSRSNRTSKMQHLNKFWLCKHSTGRARIYVVIISEVRQRPISVTTASHGGKMVN